MLQTRRHQRFRWVPQTFSKSPRATWTCMSTGGTCVVCARMRPFCTPHTFLRFLISILKNQDNLKSPLLSMTTVVNRLHIRWQIHRRPPPTRWPRNNFARRRRRWPRARGRAGAAARKIKRRVAGGLAATGEGGRPPPSILHPTSVVGETVMPWMGSAAVGEEEGRGRRPWTARRTARP